MRIDLGILFAAAFFWASNALAVEITLNSNNNNYEYSHVKNSDMANLSQAFEQRLYELNYENVGSNNGTLTADGMFSHLVGGFATVEISYAAKLQFREGRYKLTLTKFKLTDKNGTVPLEDVSGFANPKKWIKVINEKLPSILRELEKLSSAEDAW